MIHSADNEGPEGVTIVVPAYDEEDGIEGVVRRLSALDLRRPTELLVVDDGSADGTAGVLERLGAEFPTLTVLRHRRNRRHGRGRRG